MHILHAGADLASEFYQECQFAPFTDAFKRSILFRVAREFGIQHLEFERPRVI